MGGKRRRTAELGDTVVDPQRRSRGEHSVATRREADAMRIRTGGPDRALERSAVEDLVGGDPRVVGRRERIDHQRAPPIERRFVAEFDRTAGWRRGAREVGERDSEHVFESEEFVAASGQRRTDRRVGERRDFEDDARSAFAISRLDLCERGFVEVFFGVFFGAFTEPATDDLVVRRTREGVDRESAGDLAAKRVGFDGDRRRDALVDEQAFGAFDPCGEFDAGEDHVASRGEAAPDCGAGRGRAPGSNRRTWLISSPFLRLPSTANRETAVTHPFLDLASAVAPHFAIQGELIRIAPYHRGHIHDTFVSEWREDYGVRRYLHQRMNERVFEDISSLMHNVGVVTRHLQRKQMNDPVGTAFLTLELVAPREGGTFRQDETGAWRTYRFIENTETFDLCREPSHARDAAFAFGRFQAQLADLDPASLRETIPNFFSSPHRLRQFDRALEATPSSRRSEAGFAIEFAHARRDRFAVFEERQRTGAIPTRIVHGDTKLNNVLFDRDSHRAVAIVDLDTCMPAWSLYDFGDLVRFTAATAPEDERDLSKVSMNLDLYHALVAGYRESTRSFLTADEVELLPFSARLVTLTVGTRFLTDYLNGDVYFKIDPSRPLHNLERARAQFAMVAAMEGLEREMRVS